VRNPIHATGVGLLLFGRENYVRRGRAVPVANGMRTVVDRMRSWFQGNF
jgi:cell division protein FtsA